MPRTPFAEPHTSHLQAADQFSEPKWLTEFPIISHYFFTEISGTQTGAGMTILGHLSRPLPAVT